MKEKQITIAELKSTLGLKGWSNNDFANWICCLLQESAERDEFKAERYRAEDDIEGFELYRDCAENTRERKNTLHTKLREYGAYDKLYKRK